MSERSGRFDDIPMLSTGEAFRAVYAAIGDPGQFCDRIGAIHGAWPDHEARVETMQRWQTRAVLAALAKLQGKEPPF